MKLIRFANWRTGIVSFASTVLLNPVGSLRLTQPQKPNRFRAPRGGA
jgi:hypothetical protein